MRQENLKNPGEYGGGQHLRVVAAQAISSSELWMGATGKAKLATFFSAVATRITNGGSSRVESIPTPGQLAQGIRLRFLAAQAIGYALYSASPRNRAALAAFFTDCSVKVGATPQTFAGSPESADSVIPMATYGATETFNSVPFTLYTNATGNSRYIAVPNSKITSAARPAVTDAVTTEQVIAEVTLPAGVLLNQDTVSLAFVTNVTPAFGSTGSALIRFGNSGDMRKNYSGMSAAVVSSGTINISANAGTIGISANETGGTYFFVSNGNLRDINTLAPITIQLIAKPDTTTGRSFTGSLVATLNPFIPVVVPGAVTVDPRDRPFAATSLWNTPLGVDAAYQTGTDPETANFRDRTGSQRFWRSESLRVYQAKQTDEYATWSFSNRSTAFLGGWPFVNTNVPGTVKFRTPAGISAAASGADNNLAIFTPDGRFYIEAWHYSYNAETNVHTCTVLTVHDLYGAGFPVTYNRQSLYNSNVSTGIRAAGSPLLAGLIRKADFDRGYIDHVVCGILSLQKCKKIPAVCVSPVGGPVVASGGTGYVVGEVLTVVGGTGTRSAELTVTAVNAGVITAAWTTNAGDYTVGPTGTITTTSNKAGTGATFTLGLVNSNAYGTRVWPATNQDSAASSYAGKIAMGTLLAIPPSVNVEALSISAEGKILARALQKYGMLVVDTSDQVTNNMLCYSGDVPEALITSMSGYSGSPRFKCDVLEALADLMVVVRNNTPSFPGGPGARVSGVPVTAGPTPL